MNWDDYQRLWHIYEENAHLGRCDKCGMVDHVVNFAEFSNLATQSVKNGDVGSIIFEAVTERVSTLCHKDRLLSLLQGEGRKFAN